MSVLAKKRLLGAILALVSLWPLSHFALYHAAGIDPWKLFGWAMYARPRNHIQITALALRGGEPHPLHPPSPRQREVFARVNARRAAFGELAGVDALAEVLLEENPEVDALRIRVRTTDFDPQSGYFNRERTDDFDYAR